MNEELDELASLVVGFLQQSLKENPSGFSLREFDRVFPERTDEPRDWYKRYKKSSTLGALELIKDHVILSHDPHFGGNFIQLNPKSSKVDKHLVDLIVNQKTSTKKRRGSGRPSQSDRARASFALNRQYSNDRREGSYRSRLNQSHLLRHENNYSNRPTPPPPRQTIYEDPATRAAPGDPRASRNFVPPQIKPSRPSSIPSHKTTTTSRSTPTTAPSATVKPSVQSPAPKPQDVQEDPGVYQRKLHVRQRILSMLTRRYSEIKLLHLANLYHLEYAENLDPASLGHKNLSGLFTDPVMKEQIELGFRVPFHFIYAKAINGKENVAQNGSAGKSQDDQPVKPHVIRTYSRHKLEAIDPFNVKTMLLSLQPIKDIKEPDLKHKSVEDAIKYKTLRIIFRSENHRMKLDDWERKFEQESRLKIRIRDYGFKTLLEFFKHLAQEMPIKIRLDKNDNWYAELELDNLSNWLHQQMAQEHYKVMWVMDSNYELAALPTDNYNFVGTKDLTPSEDYYPVMILSVSETNLMWIQMRTPRKIEEHLCIESGLTCYEDYKKQGLFKVHDYFIRPGFPCAVFEESQQRWCRALILRSPELPVQDNDEVIALLVDYGLVRRYPIERLSCLMKQHLRLPVGLIYSKLAGVSGSERAERLARIILTEYTSPPVTLACRFVGALESNEPKYLPNVLFEVTLVDTRHGKDSNLAEEINHSIQDDD